MNNFDQTLKMSGRRNLSSASYPFLILFSWEIPQKFFFSCFVSHLLETDGWYGGYFHVQSNTKQREDENSL